ncbi:MAG: hypothetical protein Kow0029_27450 [Candidatus Rifleibacteriota bacterium]
MKILGKPIVCLKKSLALITLAVLFGSGFSACSQLNAAERKLAKEPVKKAEVKTEESPDEPSDDLFLKEIEANEKFLPDIYRCPECGYEQDEMGFCPDHNEIELVKVISRGRDPMEPSELDGNEDIVVDIPLKNLEFRKEAVFDNASNSQEIKNSLREN